MFSRLLKPPNHSFLLLGPRGTGKSTWIREHFPDIPTYDLLNTAEALRLSKEPHLLFNELQGLKKESWAIIDEVQKVPALLDEVHRLMETKSIKFVLCGSSARKLKRGGANLLAGRARTVQLFPLVSPEINDDVKLPDYFLFGSLPLSITDHDPKSYLKSYAETYLQEEIKGEAATRNIGAFGRFLEVAARQNGQITNISNIARDAQVARQTVQGYFDILVDTLLGCSGAVHLVRAFVIGILTLRFTCGEGLQGLGEDLVIRFTGRIRLALAARVRSGSSFAIRCPVLVCGACSGGCTRIPAGVGAGT